MLFRIGIFALLAALVMHVHAQLPLRMVQPLADYAMTRVNPAIPHVRPDPVALDWPSNNAPLLRLFHYPGQGFVLTSARHQLPPILAAVPHVDPFTHAIPPPVQWILRQYAAEALTAQHRAPTPAQMKAWENVTAAARAGQFAGPACPLPPIVGPLTSTTWNQTCYYNALCPADGGGSCGRTYTGCGATAMAQVMKYHAWPDSGYGSNSYTPAGYPLQTVNFGSAQYLWGSMPNAISAANAEIAEVSYHCGVAVDMMYSTTSSNSYFSDLDNALRSHFRYSLSTRSYSKLFYSDASWDSLIRSEINLLRPLMFNGGTHFWVLDGYQTAPDLYRMNWGWGGTYNGWYALTNLNPGSLSFSNTGVTAGIKPAGPFEVFVHALHYGVSGSAQNFEVVSDSAWTATPSQPWLTISPTSGTKGYFIITATAAANPTYLTRTAYIAIQRGAYKDTVWVDQAPILPSLSASPATILEGGGGGGHNITVSSDSNWVVSGASPWISFAPGAGIGAGTVSITVAANGGGARQGFVAFQRGSRVDTVFVDQSGGGSSWCVPPVGVPTAVGITRVLMKTLNRSSVISEGYLVAPDSTLLFRDSTYRIYVTFTGSVAPAIWLDWNQDGDFFDTGEALMPPVGSWYPTFGGMKTLTFTVPGTAGIGMTRLRVYTKTFPGPTASPCAATGVGDVEDFNVWISPGSPMDGGNITLALSEKNLLVWQSRGLEQFADHYQLQKWDGAVFNPFTHLDLQQSSFRVEESGEYRLAAISPSGQAVFSNVVSATVDETPWSIFPNPLQAGLDLTIQTTDGSIDFVEVFDLGGRLLAKVNGLSSQTLRLNTDQFPAGRLLVKASVRGQVMYKHITVL